MKSMNKVNGDNEREATIRLALEEGSSFRRSKSHNTLADRIYKKLLKKEIELIKEEAKQIARDIQWTQRTVSTKKINEYTNSSSCEKNNIAKTVIKQSMKWKLVDDEFEKLFRLNSSESEISVIGNGKGKIKFEECNFNSSIISIEDIDVEFVNCRFSNSVIISKSDNIKIFNFYKCVLVSTVLCIDSQNLRFSNSDVKACIFKIQPSLSKIVKLDNEYLFSETKIDECDFIIYSLSSIVGSRRNELTSILKEQSMSKSKIADYKWI